MTIRVQLEFADTADLLAFFGGNAAAAAAAVTKADTKADAKAAKSETKAEPKPEPKPEVKKPAHTREEMQAALQELKEKTDAATAKGVISEFGGVAKMAEIPDDKIDAVYDAAKAKIEEAM